MNINEAAKSRATIQEYISEALATAPFATLSDRITLAGAFLDGYAQLGGENKLATSPMTPFMSPSTLRITELTDTDGGARIAVDFSGALLDGEQVFDNFCYASPRVFEGRAFYNAYDRERGCRVKDVRAKCRDEHALDTVARILFYIVFCHNPYMGREYYLDFDISPKHDIEFFLEGGKAEERKYIFDIDGNPNRYVNGFQEYAYETFWVFSEEQRALISGLFEKKEGVTVESLVKEWHRLFDYEDTFVRTPCDVRIKAMMFGDGQFIMTAPAYVSRGIYYCYKHSGSMVDTCRACSIEPSKQITSFHTQQVTVRVTERTTDADGQEVKTETEKRLKIYSGKRIRVCDLIGVEDTTVIFVAIAANKPGVKLLGLRYMLDGEKILATTLKQSKKLKKGDVVALLPDTEIFALEGCVIETDKTPKKEKPLPNKLDKQEPEAENKAEDSSPDTDGGKDESVPEPVVEPEVAVDEPVAEPQADALRGVFTEDGSVGSLPRIATVTLESGEALDVVDSGKKEHALYLRYTVIRQGTLDCATMYIAKDAYSEPFAAGVRAATAMADYESVPLPRALVMRDNSFIGNRLAYITRYISSRDEESIATVINGRSNIPLPELVNMFIGLFASLDSLHDKGLSHKRICSATCNYSASGKTMYLVANHGMWYERSQGFFGYVPDEVAVLSQRADKYADTYGALTLLFKALFRMNDFKRDNLFDPRYISKRSDGSYNIAFGSEAVERRWRALPVYIQEMFILNYTRGVANLGYKALSSEAKNEEKYRVNKDREHRPSASLCASLLERWLDELTRPRNNPTDNYTYDGGRDSDTNGSDTYDSGRGKADAYDSDTYDNGGRRRADISDSDTYDGDDRRERDRYDGERRRDGWGKKYVDLKGERFEVDDKIYENDTVAVYKLKGNSERKLVLKEYLRPQHRARLSQLEDIVKDGAPAGEFNWPYDVVRMPRNGRIAFAEPAYDKRYTTAKDIIEGKAGFASSELLVKALYNLVNALDSLIGKGKCHGNICPVSVRFNLDTADVLICECENVSTDGRLLTICTDRRYMAPEVIRASGGRDKAAALQTYDRGAEKFIISVLLFSVIMGEHPFEGLRAASVPDSARANLYGDPVFILQGDEFKNAPTPETREQIKRRWEALPDAIRDSFTATFTDGISDKSMRTSTAGWRRLLKRWLDKIINSSKGE